MFASILARSNASVGTVHRSFTAAIERGRSDRTRASVPRCYDEVVRCASLLALAVAGCGFHAGGGVAADDGPLAHDAPPLIVDAPPDGVLAIDGRPADAPGPTDAPTINCPTS